MFIKSLLFLSFFSLLHANQLIKKNYYVESDSVMLSNIVPHIKKEDSLLFKIHKNKYSTRIKSKNLIKMLHNHGYDNFTAKDRFINFIKKSNINVSKIKNSIEKFYLQHYKTITIKKISVLPRGYIKSLPNDYMIHIPKRAYLSNQGTIDIKTPSHKKIFLDYTIEATIDSYTAKENIKRKTPLSTTNTRKNTIPLSKFRALPVEKISPSTIQAKNPIRMDNIITLRDIVTLSIVRKNDMVNAIIDDGNIAISFAAKALKDGKHGDIIKIQKRDGKRFKAIVIGKNRVKVQ